MIPEKVRKYRKKPVVIEAMQFTDETKDRCFNFVTCNTVAGFDSLSPDANPTLVIQTLEGEMTASIGDFIIKGVQGEFYPCKPDIFEQTYEEFQTGKDENRRDLENKRVKEKTKTIYDLELHSRLHTPNGLSVLRVPGGWIYEITSDQTDGYTHTFVPFHYEFHPQYNERGTASKTCEVING